MASSPLMITIPLDPEIVEGIIRGDKVCSGLIAKAVQAAIEQGYHLKKSKEETMLKRDPLAYKERLYVMASTIATIDIVKFATRMLDIAPEPFWVMPASSTGKHHREDECADGGLALHTIRCAIVAQHLIQMVGNLTVLQQNLLTGAALLHDICKNGIFAESRYTVPHHALLVRDLAYMDNEARKLSQAEGVSDIFPVIEAHMGRWSADAAGALVKPPDGDLGRLLHIADYFASRKDIAIEV